MESEAPKRTRTSLSEIEGQITNVIYINGDTLAMASQDGTSDITPEAMNRLKVLTVCLLQTRNGFMVLGKSAPPIAESFDAEYGRRLSYEDALRQLWKLEGYVLRERLYEVGS